MNKENKKIHISNNCKNEDEGHQYCWDKDCECKCHRILLELDEA